MAVKTGWVRIGRSGETVDGRVIEPEWLTQAAENYDKEFYSAPVWPGHSTWYRLGTVLVLKAEGNKEGGVDLYAIIEPNAYYQQAVKAGQMLHTSMELRPNFRNQGSWYLQGLAATDEPASMATSEMKFSTQKDHVDSVFTGYVENKQHTFKDNDDDQPPGWFTKYFKKKPDEDDAEMADKKELEQLKKDNAVLKLEIEKLKGGGDDDENGGGDEPEKIQFATTDDFNQLKDVVQKLSDVMANGQKDDALKKLSEQVEAQAVKLEAAINEQGGTDTPESTGGEDFKASAYQ